MKINENKVKENTFFKVDFEKSKPYFTRKMILIYAICFASGYITSHKEILINRWANVGTEIKLIASLIMLSVTLRKVVNLLNSFR